MLLMPVIDLEVHQPPPLFYLIIKGGRGMISDPD